MSQPLGSFCLVLHGHLPYVLCHGEWPHGEDWLYEAAAETYLPILAMIDECLYLDAAPTITMGLTPVLLEQLCHEHFKKGFEQFLKDFVERAEADAKEFGTDQPHMAYLANRWAKWYGDLLEQFIKIDRDIPTAFGNHAKAGRIEILTSNATHGYMPLLLDDNAIRAQMRAGIASSHRILGFRPTGMWMPECAYRPGGMWKPAIAWGQEQMRTGVEHLIGSEGVTHVFVENHLIEQSRSEFVLNDGQWQKVDWDESRKYPNRGWQDVHEPMNVNSDGLGPGPIAAFGRDQSICEKVWSGSIGYPASGEYLEFHKKHGARRGLRYWKVTGKGADLGEKDMYYPDDTKGKVFAHAKHFCDSVKDSLRAYRDKTGRHGVVTASFDAELFGHWWFEGPQFLRDVLLTLHSDPDIDVQTTEQFLESHPPDKCVSMPEGSWGEEGDHRVWMNDQTKWMWEVEYRCEMLFGKLTYEMPWDDPKHPLQKPVADMLAMAGRELLLLQASDWPFVITRGQAIDYGIKRFVGHVGRFENLCDMTEKIARGDELTDLNQFEIKDAQMHDIIFPEMDLHWWDGPAK